MSQRTTLTLDDDVAARLREEVRLSGKSLKAVANDALRAGLASRREPPGKRFRVIPRDLGVRPEIDLDDVEGLLDRIEGADRR